MLPSGQRRASRGRSFVRRRAGAGQLFDDVGSRVGGDLLDFGHRALARRIECRSGSSRTLADLRVGHGEARLDRLGGTGASLSETRTGTFLSGGKLVASQTLSSREREVIQLVAEGKSNRDIAERWKVSIKTVESHRTAAMRKLNLRSGVELALYAVRNKLIEP